MDTRALQAPAPLGSGLRLPARPSSLAAARRYSEQAACAFGMSGECCYEVAYAVNEAVTNAIRHGAPDGWGDIGLSILMDHDRLTFVVRDSGTFQPPSESSASSDHGRGLALMAALMDDVRVQVEPGGTTIHLTKSRA